MSTTINPKAYPLATTTQTELILKTIQALKDSNNIKTGANETTKILNKGKGMLVILAGDCEPFEIGMHIPLICENKNVPFLYVESKLALGKACDVLRPVIACAIYCDNESNYKRINQAVKKILESPH